MASDYFKKSIDDMKNRMSTNLVKSEIYIRFNYVMTCSQFYDYIKIKQN